MNADRRRPVPRTRAVNSLPPLNRPPSLAKLRNLSSNMGITKLTIEQMQALARERKGVCLSTAVYVNGKTKLRWRCSESHEWEAAPGNIKKGHWCPECRRVAQRRAPA